eukprot:CAMPEP_0201506188 /NCGR_PEP_ID=MMETSP0161_2-20130828/117_1 /ASSEMBLY_ACC=CAM_ASM_000251 /TAXON_ID=180227 /ORGANISM="Neoparamoeba aestuarina, Strain SoJaBio B1-5/56/2" /LENGTH=125 /DNA_ID=CAMNT_0047900217 /DNA_START=93 /DNA_END=470 /DNA_ORIENTATION=+
MPSSCLFVIHDSVGGGENNVPELTGGEEVDHPLLNLVVSNIESGGDNPALVDPTIELNNDFAGSVIIDDLKFTNVLVLHHNFKKFDDDLGARANHNLAFSASLGVDNSHQGIVKNRRSHHTAGLG